MDTPTSVPRYLVRPETLDAYEEVTSDVLVIGGGVAGLSAAIAAASSCRVAVVTKEWLTDSNTAFAQGGVAAVLARTDSIEQHIADTLNVGQGICDESVVRHVVGEGPAAIRRLIEWGGQFDMKDGDFALSKEGGHSEGRVLHAGDATGLEIQRVLTEYARSLRRIAIYEHTYVLDLLSAEGRCVGALARAKRGFVLFRAGAVILCTGGVGQVYRETTNPEVATGDGPAMAFRAGAVLRGMEFVQFHPTTLYFAGVARILISETLRGEGGVLRDKFGNQFMKEYHPSAELAPRDVVSRAIMDTMAKTGDTNVYLDLTHLPSTYVRERFPRINRACANYGIDITREMIPVHPTAHYMIGGVRVDEQARSNIPGLFAAGEAACSGLHGGNRLGSNSLLEGLVLGSTAGRVASRELPSRIPTAAYGGAPLEGSEGMELDATDMRNSLKSLTWRQCGIQREGDSLRDALRKLDKWARFIFKAPATTVEHWELANMVTVALLITRSALLREESRGVHYRRDFPDRDDVHWRGYIELQLDENGEVQERYFPLAAASETEESSREPSSSGAHTR
ncbi:MAG: L-aspartate oxidase [Planctomycetota bacterium]